MTQNANEDIKAKRVTVISDDGKKLGEFLTSDAIRMASEKGLSLVEVDPNPSIPVCKFMDLGKFLYEQKKKDKERKSNQKEIKVKEVKLSVNTAEHDLLIKVGQGRKFLERGDKLKVTVTFTGREGDHVNLLENKCYDVYNALAEICEIETGTKLSKNPPCMFMILKPKSK